MEQLGEHQLAYRSALSSGWDCDLEILFPYQLHVVIWLVTRGANGKCGLNVALCSSDDKAK